MDWEIFHWFSFYLLYIQQEISETKKNVNRFFAFVIKMNSNNSQKKMFLVKKMNFVFSPCANNKKNYWKVIQLSHNIKNMMDFTLKKNNNRTKLKWRCREMKKKLQKCIYNLLSHHSIISRIKISHHSFVSNHQCLSRSSKNVSCSKWKIMIAFVLSHKPIIKMLARIQSTGSINKNSN